MVSMGSQSRAEAMMLMNSFANSAKGTDMSSLECDPNWLVRHSLTSHTQNAKQHTYIPL